jgi:hypothetical protein
VSLGLPKHFGILDVSETFGAESDICEIPTIWDSWKRFQHMAGCAENYQFSKLLEPSYPFLYRIGIEPGSSKRTEYDI